MSLRYLTAGESHGPGLTAILEGLPAHLSLTSSDINKQLARRQKGYGRGGRMAIESDSVEILSGVRHGKTLGSPIALWIENKDFCAWQNEMSVEPVAGFVSKKTITKPRPGHVDLNGGIKYAHHDLRNILERASARETTARVAVGAVCRKFLEEFGIHVTGHVINIGGIVLKMDRPSFSEIQIRQEEDPVRCIDPETSREMQNKIDEAKKNGDTLGGIFEILFAGLPVGLGSHVHWDRKLDAKLAQTLLSIQAIKGVEFGMGFAMAEKLGSQVHGSVLYEQQSKQFHHDQNNAGGLIGGVTNGEDIVLRAVMKPLSTLFQPLPSIDVQTKKNVQATIERSDTCAVPSACVVAENILCFDIANAFLEKFGGDALQETKRNYESYLEWVQAY